MCGRSGLMMPADQAIELCRLEKAKRVALKREETERDDAILARAAIEFKGGAKLRRAAVRNAAAIA